MITIMLITIITKIATNNNQNTNKYKTSLNKKLH